MKISIKFSLAPGKASDLPIRMRIGYSGLRLDLRTGFVCPPDKWDSEAMRMKTGTGNRYHESASDINRELSRQEALIGEILARYDLDGTVPEPSVLKLDFDRRMGRLRKENDPDTGINLIEAFARYMSDPANVLESATTNSYITAQRRLRDFDFAEKPLDEITENDLSEFIGELWQDGLENQSVNLYLVRLRTMLRYAAQKKLYHGNLHDTFRPKLKGLGKKDVHYLEWEEFKLMMYVQLLDPVQIAVRDAFCFCCATGLRVSDCTSLTWSQVHLDCETPHIALVAKKTTKPTFIELNQFSRALIDRQVALGRRQDDLVFPPVNVRTRNYHLHTIAKAAGVRGLVRELCFHGNKMTEQLVEKYDAISTHWGRHTFIVHALTLGISPTIVMQWTGHASFDSMKPYIAIADTARKSNMELFNN